MQQQFDVFQSILAQLLAHNNPGDPLINLLNPTPQPSAPQQDPQLVQHAPTLSEQRGVPPPHHIADSIPHPLNTNITLEPYPVGFKIPQLETYDGMKDPDDHPHAFYYCMQAQNAFDALMCKIFLSTLQVLEVSSIGQTVGIAAVISSLNHERFRDSLIKHLAATFNESRKWMRTAQNQGPMSTSTPRFGKSNSAPPQQFAVLVKKANGKWRMCIDYANLNQACPKDCYPMSSIDKLVEEASGNERLSLLDAYYGYHQVPMAPEDEEKTSFYAGDEIYCYVMMPFGLKNAGATYQKMVTIVFQAQIGRNLEIYVDDIVIKSLKAEDHLADLDETFNNLRKNRMRLNLAKCIFGVESRKFLSFMVSQRGIKVNLEKIRTITEMEPPKLVKDI
ncbi:hypothetical protein SLEP1_g17242 [Rubroshorea leprosula]|uniref:Reverse transcriptase domain-containing protein n=1 Tax=Rubroshorea leprosula TaxID=152421 RepID=A0AAV5J178_9ROSI|nr:hypothetical protein SLEP1_g17242 [Rubroshorea leprosula]